MNAHLQADPAGGPDDYLAGFTGQTVFCLGTHEWEAHWTPVQQVMSRLAPANRVIYFEPFHPWLSWMRGKHKILAERRRNGEGTLREVQDNLLVYQPNYPYMPWNMRSGLAAGYNSLVYRREIAALMRRLGVKRPWLWSYFAQSLSVLDLDFEHFVYDCVDDWPAFFPDPREKQFVAALDEELCRRAEVLFVGSQPLLETKQAFNDRIFVVNHAADVAHFMRASDETEPVPEDIARIKGPRIGFVGMMDEVRFDADLIAELAGTGKYQVVLVGGFIGAAEKAVEGLPNVHRLGMKSIAQLPGYLKGMDVCMMPYRLNDATRSIYPLKLHEYLATGKPVVATAIPAAEQHPDVIRVAHSHAEFQRLVDEALAESDPADRARRQAVAAQNSWEHHVAAKLRVLGTEFA